MSRPASRARSASSETAHSTSYSLTLPTTDEHLDILLSIQATAVPSSCAQASSVSLEQDPYLLAPNSVIHHESLVEVVPMAKLCTGSLHERRAHRVSYVRLSQVETKPRKHPIKRWSWRAPCSVFTCLQRYRSSSKGKARVLLGERAPGM